MSQAWTNIWVTFTHTTLQIKGHVLLDVSRTKTVNLYNASTGYIQTNTHAIIHMREQDHGSPINPSDGDWNSLWQQHLISPLYWTVGYPSLSQHQLVSSSSTTLNICLGLTPRGLTGTYSTTPFILGAFPGEFFFLITGYFSLLFSVLYLDHVFWH